MSLTQKIMSLSLWSVVGTLYGEMLALSSIQKNNKQQREEIYITAAAAVMGQDGFILCIQYLNIPCEENNADFILQS